MGREVEQPARGENPVGPDLLQEGHLEILPMLFLTLLLCLSHGTAVRHCIPYTLAV